MTSFSGVTCVLFCFVFVFKFSLKPRPFVQSSFDMQHPDSHPCFFFFFGDVAFSEYFFVSFPLSLCIEYVVRSFLPNAVFLPCDRGLDFLHQFM